jgi:hypothetical protein
MTPTLPIQEREMSRKFALATVSVALACATPSARATVSASFVCPPDHSGFSLWDVSAAPYVHDNTVDEKGNNDGFVCAKPGGVFILDDDTPFQLYNFIDNHVVVPQ